MRSIIRNFTFVALVTLTVAAFGQNYDLSWNTIDGGGATFSTGGAYSLGGTIGQPDAGAAMTGGSFTLVGGFWPGGSSACTCPGDTNGDGVRDALDIQNFVNCLIAAQGCSCADVDGSGTVTAADAAVFVNTLVSGATC